MIQFLRVLFHTVGFGCLGCSVALQFLTFFGILTQGLFKANEPNLTILWIEILVTAFAGIYLCYLFYLVYKISEGD